jgi:DNA-binding transcriptional regulator GbsR (MarR family)
MEIAEAKEQFVQTWGNLATQWGINRTMAQIHALLLLSPEAMSTDALMEALSISRGNANMNVRALLDWGLVQKVYVKGERKEFFMAIKEPFTIARRIAAERQKRELSPVVNMLEQMSVIEGDSAEAAEMRKFTRDMHEMTKDINTLLAKFGNSEPSWWQKKLISLLR